MQLKGKIGVYGRSLGGIASCHLAKTYPTIISALIVDRTFSDMGKLSSRRLRGRFTETIFKALSFDWKTHNDYNFVKV